MKVEVFVGTNGDIAVVEEVASRNLPADLGPWGKEKDLELEEDDEPRAGLDTKACLRDIADKHYHIAKAKLGSAD